jgi:cytoplasmic iron level regulating protein YaaA (DUF328/UPF0246 family)
VLILLPPSETKRDGGSGAPLDLDTLSFPSLRPVREEVVEALLALSADHEAAMRALKLGPRQAGEVDRNRAILTSPTMPALHRYTGVLYDALSSETLSPAAERFAASTVAVKSALLGLVGAADRIPAYRLSFDSRLSFERGAPSLTRRWAPVSGAALAAHGGVILDLRSAGYAALGPLPDRAGAHYVRVFARDERGDVRALNHFNKQAKGLLTRALLEAGIDFVTTAELLDWARSERYELTAAADGSGDLHLIVPEVVGSPGSLLAVLRTDAA